LPAAPSVRFAFAQDGIFDHITCLGGDEYEYKDHKRQNKNDGVIFTPEEDDYWSAKCALLKERHSSGGGQDALHEELQLM
jgi:hypothetical protein